jgi:hypothetical protein
MADSHCTYLEGFTSEVDPNSISEKGHIQILPLRRGADPWPDTLSHLGSHYVREFAAEIPLSTIDGPSTYVFTIEPDNVA